MGRGKKKEEEKLVPSGSQQTRTVPQGPRASKSNVVINRLLGQLRDQGFKTHREGPSIVLSYESSRLKTVKAEAVEGLIERAQKNYRHAIEDSIYGSTHYPRWEEVSKSVRVDPKTLGVKAEWHIELVSNQRQAEAV